MKKISYWWKEIKSSLIRAAENYILMKCVQTFSKLHLFCLAGTHKDSAEIEKMGAVMLFMNALVENCCDDCKS